ncbi:alanine racemase [Gammaproteobacteria bacterium 45_16_T64]|nr:alanine racemase [Gammaproteobacteria bacterium 45_16_T64]
MSRGTCAVIDLSALRHNYQLIKQRAPHSQILAVVKADGYGHGLSSIARALNESDGFGVAILEEALLLRAAGITQKIVMLEGALSIEELRQASESRVDVVVHQLEQVAEIELAGTKVFLNVWLKIDTGMHRLGVDPADAEEAYLRLSACAGVEHITLMSHFSSADDADERVSREQYALFEQLKARLLRADPQNTFLPASLANSAGIFQHADFHYDWVRPGVALYGGSPAEQRKASEFGLRPVMTLMSRVLSLRLIARGECVGYGASWTANKDTLVAIVAIGYGDGYPRHMNDDACVLVGGTYCSVIGRVSMDMIAVNVSALQNVAINDPVILWGEGLPVEMAAEWADTINYELLCQVTDRVDHRYVGLEEE